MAKQDTPVTPPVTEKKKRAPRVVVDPNVRKCAAILKEVGTLYVEASKAMLNNDVAKALSDVDLSVQYMDLFRALAKNLAENETVEALVTAQEM